MRIRRLLDRLFPHDTLHVGGHPYMHRWYVFGYAPTPDDPDARFVCATCKEDLARTQDLLDRVWTFRHFSDDPRAEWDHEPAPVSAPREGWWWQDHGVGAFRIHCTVASDDSRAFHDHPWDWCSIIIRGAYLERQPLPEMVHRDELGIDWCPLVDGSQVTRRLFAAPAVNRKRATDLHVLEVVRGPVWSLFFTRPKVRSWGFAGPFGWYPWRQFDERYPERDAYTEQGQR